MLYYETNDRKGKIIGAIASGIYLVLIVVLMLVVRFEITERDFGEGILINFGDTEQASGLRDTDVSTTPASASSSSAPDTSPEDMVTQDYDEAPEVQQQSQRPQNRQEPQQSSNAAATQQPRTEPVVQQPERQVNRNALFPGMTAGSTSSSEGTASQGAGNQGTQEGSPQGSHDGTGGGGGGTGFDLAGRSVMGSLPQPVYGANKSGRVIVEIVVDPAGKVVNASYRARGSTTNDGELVNAALRAARQSKFNAITADANQTGTITYNFKLK